MSERARVDEALRAGRIEEALRIAADQVSTLRSGPPTVELARALVDLTRADARANRLPAAVEAAEEGLRICRGGDDGTVEADLRTVLADVYERLGEVVRADELCTAALGQLLEGRESIDRGAYSVFPGLARRKVSAARISERRGHLRRAAYLLDGVFADAGLATSPRFTASADVAANTAFLTEIEHVVRLHRGRVARKLDERSSARAGLTAALTQAREVGDVEVVMYAHAELAVLASAGNDPASGLNHMLEALWWYESGLSGIRDDELRVAARLTQEELFGRAVDKAMEVRLALTAWRLSEHARARVFRARMAGTPAVPPAAAPSGAEPPDGLRKPLKRYHSHPTDKRWAEVLDALQTKERAVFAGSGPLPAVPEWPARPPDAPWSPGPDTAVLEFFLSDTQLYSFFFTREEARIYQLPLSSAVLSRAVTRLRQLVEAPEQDLDDRAELAQRSGQLYRWLVEPHAELMDGLRRLVVVPYGILNYVPFAMLGRDRTLLDQVEVCLAPSAAIVDDLLAAAAPVVRTAMVFADPHPDDDRLGLPYSAQEARRVAATLPGDIAYGPAATTTRFRAAFTGFDVLHLACHAAFDRYEPQRSGVLLADPADPRRPAHLTVRDLYGGKTDARMAVLSGCQTGLADVAPGGELDGLVRAFLIAGVRTVVASQWRVDDEATADVMAQMYDNLVAGTPVGAALRAAQLAVRDSTRFTHPYFWSGFELSGDWRLTAGRA
jgi:CHAT domain-containing protein